MNIISEFSIEKYNGKLPFNLMVAPSGYIPDPNNPSSNIVNPLFVQYNEFINGISTIYSNQTVNGSIPVFWTIPSGERYVPSSDSSLTQLLSNESYYFIARSSYVLPLTVPSIGGSLPDENSVGPCVKDINCCPPISCFINGDLSLANKKFSNDGLGAYQVTMASNRHSLSILVSGLIPQEEYTYSLVKNAGNWNGIMSPVTGILKPTSDRCLIESQFYFDPLYVSGNININNPPPVIYNIFDLSITPSYEGCNVFTQDINLICSGCLPAITSTPTRTPTPSPTASPTPTPSPTPTNTPTSTPTRTPTPTPSMSPTPTSTASVATVSFDPNDIIIPDGRCFETNPISVNVTNSNAGYDYNYYFSSANTDIKFYPSSGIFSVGETGSGTIVTLIDTDGASPAVIQVELTDPATNRSSMDFLVLTCENPQDNVAPFPTRTPTPTSTPVPTSTPTPTSTASVAAVDFYPKNITIQDGRCYKTNPISVNVTNSQAGYNYQYAFSCTNPQVEISPFEGLYAGGDGGSGTITTLVDLNGQSPAVIQVILTDPSTNRSSMDFLVLTCENDQDNIIPGVTPTPTPTPVDCSMQIAINGDVSKQAGAYVFDGFNVRNLTLAGSGNNEYNLSIMVTGVLPGRTYRYGLSEVDSNADYVISPSSGVFSPSKKNYIINTKFYFENNENNQNLFGNCDGGLCGASISPYALLNINVGAPSGLSTLCYGINETINILCEDCLPGCCNTVPSVSFASESVVIPDGRCYKNNPITINIANGKPGYNYHYEVTSLNPQVDISPATGIVSVGNGGLSNISVLINVNAQSPSVLKVVLTDPDTDKSSMDFLTITCVNDKDNITMTPTATSSSTPTPTPTQTPTSTPTSIGATPAPTSSVPVVTPSNIPYNVTLVANTSAGNGNYSDSNNGITFITDQIGSEFRFIAINDFGTSLPATMSIRKNGIEVGAVEFFSAYAGTPCSIFIKNGTMVSAINTVFGSIANI
jgi:hypothetical protein